IDYNRDLLLPVAEIRQREEGMTGNGRGCNTVSFPELRRGKVAIFIATLLARLLRPNQIPAIQRYASMEAAYFAAHRQLSYYRALEHQPIQDDALIHCPACGAPMKLRMGRRGSFFACSKYPKCRTSLSVPPLLRWIRDWPTLENHVKAWEANESGSEPLGFILSMEGADPVLSPDQVQEWWDAGLRIIGPAHYGVSPYAHGTGTEGGLF